MIRALLLTLSLAIAADASAKRPEPEAATGALVIVLDTLEAPASKDRLKLFRKVFKKERRVVGARDLGTVFCFSFAGDIDEELVGGLVTKAEMPIATVRRAANCDRPPGEAFQVRSTIVERWNVTLDEPMLDTDLKILLLGALQRGNRVAEMLIPQGTASAFCVSFDMPPDRSKWEGVFAEAGLAVKAINTVTSCPKP